MIYRIYSLYTIYNQYTYIYILHVIPRSGSKKQFGVQFSFLLPELEFPGNSYFGGVQPMVPPVREFPGNFLTGAAES